MHTQEQDRATGKMLFDKVDHVVGGEEVVEAIDMECGPDAIHPSIYLLAEHRNDRVAKAERIMDLEGREGTVRFRFIAVHARPSSGTTLASSDDERLECIQSK